MAFIIARKTIRTAASLAVILLLALSATALGGDAALAQSSDTVTEEEVIREGIGGAVPGNSLGTSSDADFWRSIRQGEQGVIVGAQRPR